MNATRSTRPAPPLSLPPPFTFRPAPAAPPSDDVETLRPAPAMALAPVFAHSVTHYLSWTGLLFILAVVLATGAVLALAARRGA
jgi:hypothetical protein